MPSDVGLSLSVEQKAHQITQGLGYNISQNSYVELGALVEKGSLHDDFLLNDEVKFDALGVYASFGFDNLDSASFPTHGKRLLIQFISRREDVDNERLYTGELTDFGGRTLELDIEWKGAFNIGSHSVVSKADFTRINADKDDGSVHAARLGGFLNLSGLDSNELTGSHKAFYAVMYQYNLRENLFGQNKLPLYLGFSHEAGNVWSVESDIDLSDVIFGSSVYLGTDTAAGPAALGYGITNEKDKSIYFYLGYNL